MPEIPAAYQQAQEKRYREAERRMRELAGKQQALQERGLRSKAGQRGFTAGTRAGSELGILGNIGAQTSAEVIQKARELESQRLTEEQKWLEGERRYEQQLGAMGAGYGYQRELQQMKQDFQGKENALKRALEDALTRGGWSHEAEQLQRQIEANRDEWQAQLGWQKEYGRGTLGLEEQKLSQQAEQFGLTLDWQKEEFEKMFGEEGFERWKQGQIEALTKAGWDREDARAEADRRAQYGYEDEDGNWVPGLQERLQAQEQEFGAARQEAALDWERQKMYGLDYAKHVGAGVGGRGGMLGGPGGTMGGGGGYGGGYGGGGGGYGGLYGLQAGQLALKQQALQQEAEQFQSRYGEGGFEERMAEQQFGYQQTLQEMQQNYGIDLQALKWDQGQAAAVMQNHADWVTLYFQGELSADELNKATKYSNLLFQRLGFIEGGAEGEKPQYFFTQGGPHPGDSYGGGPATGLPWQQGLPWYG